MRLTSADVAFMTNLVFERQPVLQGRQVRDETGVWHVWHMSGIQSKASFMSVKVAIYDRMASPLGNTEPTELGVASMVSSVPAQ
eukprot:806426-Pelagomonas_calceolata.AAC.5